MNGRHVALTGGLGVLAFAVAVGTLSAVVGRDRESTPLIAEPGPGRRAVTAPAPTTSGPNTGASESGRPAPLAPAASGERASASPSRSPSPIPLAAGRWTGVASITVTGQDFGCTAVRTTVRRSAMLSLDHPLPGEDNAVHLAFRTREEGVAGAFAVDSSTNSPSPTRYWTLSGDGVGGLIGRLTAVVPPPLSGRPPTDNVLSAVKGLDGRCGAQISAPVAFRLGPGAALRATVTGKRASVEVSGRTADHTRTFQIAFKSP